MAARTVYFVENQMDGLSFDGALREVFGCLPEALHCLSRMGCFRGVDANQAHFFVRADDDCVTVDNADDFSQLAAL
jgi:hypothetical protein